MFEHEILVHARKHVYFLRSFALGYEHLLLPRFSIQNRRMNSNCEIILESGLINNNNAGELNQDT